MRHAAEPCEGTGGEKSKVYRNSRGRSCTRPVYISVYINVYGHVYGHVAASGRVQDPPLQLSGQQEVFHIVPGDDFE